MNHRENLVRGALYAIDQATSRLRKTSLSRFRCDGEKILNPTVPSIALAVIGEVAGVYRLASANFKKNPARFAVFSAIFRFAIIWEGE